MFEQFGDVVANSISKLASAQNKKPTDYADDNGILHCGVCGDAKQAWIELGTTRNLLPVMCRCEITEYEAQAAADKKRQFDFNLASMRSRLGIHQQDADKHTFAVDENPDIPISRTCRRYVSDWDDMRKGNHGIIFFGNKGVGKSFYAACIANALAEKQVMTAITTTALVMSIVQRKWDKAEIIDSVNHFDLLVLDDLGAERDTSYGAEIMFNIIDSRYKARRPLIVTTNLDIEDMRKETDLYRSRIYDRVLEMCSIPLKMAGESRRQTMADERRNAAREVLKRASADVGGNQHG